MTDEPREDDDTEHEPLDDLEDPPTVKGYATPPDPDEDDKPE